MKPKHFLASVLFTILGTALFAQVKPQHFQQEKSFLNRHQQIPDVNHDFNSFPISTIEPVDEFHNHYTNQNTFLPEGEFWKNGRITDEVMYACDSAFSYNTRGEKTKTIYTRDAAGRITVELVYFWAPESALMIKNYQFLNSYDATGNKITQVIQRWNPKIGEWVNLNNYSYSYDASGNLLLELRQNWVTESSDWAKSNREIFTYDGSGNKLSRLFQNWDTEIEDWQDINKDIYTYNNAGNGFTLIRQSWAGFIDKRKYIITFDDAGNMLTYIHQVWNYGSEEWTNSINDTYSYNTSGNILSLRGHIWDAKTSNWFNHYFSLYSYDTFGKLISIHEQYWYLEINNFTVNHLSIYTYDVEGNKLTELKQSMDEENDVLYNTSLSSFTYDDSGNMILELYQEWDFGNKEWDNKLKIEYEINYNTKKVSGTYYLWWDSWNFSDKGLRLSIFNNHLFFANDSYKAEAYYSSYPLGIDDKEGQSNDITSFCSPNPAKNVVNVTNLFKKEASLKIYNMNGQQLKAMPLGSDQNQISVQNYSPGIYLFVVQSGSLIVQNKVVVY